MDAGDVNSKLVLADPHITVLPDGEDAFNLGAEAFAQRSDLSTATRYASADVTFLLEGRSSSSSSLLSADGLVTYQAIEGTELLSFKRASSTGIKHAEFPWMPTDSPGAAPCVITFRTACPTCRPTDLTCAEGAVCPGGTAVSAECTDPAGAGNPCACTALQQLAGMSAELKAEAPWKDPARHNRHFSLTSLPTEIAALVNLEW